MDYTLTWNGITLRITYTPDASEAYRKIYGYALAHLEIRSVSPDRAPLPITATGYYSHFTRADNVEAYGGPLAYVQAWLDDAANSPEWQAQQAKAAQLSLF